MYKVSHKYVLKVRERVPR